MEKNKIIPEVTVYAISDIGKKRKNNEDAAYCCKSYAGSLLIVADGMGGHRKGEVASKMVIDSLSLPFLDSRSVFSKKKAKHFLSKYSKRVNRDIYDMSISGDEYREMGTTECAALIGYDGTQVFSVGDSRAYVLKDGKLNQVTRDQSYVEMLFESGRIDKAAMKSHPQRNILTNAIGLNGKLSNPEEIELSNDEFDVLLLCTDGLFNMVSDEEIAQVLNDKSLDTENKAKTLISLALEHGGIDNAAVVLAEKHHG